MPWEAIKYVGSGLTLAAFIVAAIAWLLKSKSEEKERLIDLAKEDERAGLVRDALEFFSVETAGLSKAQQYQLALEQIRARGQRFKLVTMVVCAVALVGGIVAVYAITRGTQPASKVADQPHDEKANALAQPRVPEFLERVVYRTNMIERTEYTTDPGRFSPEKLDDFLTLSRLAYGTADKTNHGFKVDLTIRNTTKETIQLDLNERFFSMADNKGRAAELIYFCCESKGDSLPPAEERIVQLIFRDAGWHGKGIAASAIYFRVQGFVPVVSASWKAPTLAMAN